MTKRLKRSINTVNFIIIAIVLKLFFCFNIIYIKKFFFLANFIFPADENFRVHRYARHELTIGASNISLEDRREWLCSRCGNSYVRIINFTILLTPLYPPPIYPSFSWQWFLSPSFSWGLFGWPLLNLRPINQTIPYKFVTREIARILGGAGRVFSLPPTHTPRGEKPLSARAYPTPSLFSARVYRRFRAHF